MEIVTCKAPINIAAIKYWGKRDEKLILPLNDSISVTISTKMPLRKPEAEVWQKDTNHGITPKLWRSMCAKTTVAASPNFTEDRMWLNGREEIITNPRLTNCLSEFREIARNSQNPKTKAMSTWRVHICSENNFPTAAGLASSAAGYACLVYSLAKLFQIEDNLSRIARRGSGSACRSIHGGYVIWKMGCLEDGSDSLAHQIAPASHWNEMKILILVVNSGTKAVGSSIAMQRSVTTSDFLQNFNGGALENRVRDLTNAILQKDFETFAQITMKDSNRLHSICQDTFPPVQYLNDTSQFIIKLVHSLNEVFGKLLVAYSFDAGPNACLFLLEANVPIVLSIINHFLPPKGSENGEPYFKGENVNVLPPSNDIIGAIPLTPRSPGALKGIIYAGVGDGPEMLPQEEHLLDSSGFPKNLS